MTVLVRDPQKLGPTAERVQVIRGSVSDPAAVRDGVAGADEVVSALGPDGNTADQVVARRDGMRTLIGVMRDIGRRPPATTARRMATREVEYFAK